MTAPTLLKQIRFWTLLFIIAIATIGISTFPLLSELAWLNGHSSLFPDFMANWIQFLYTSLKSAIDQYPFLAYGTDWLAFAHIIIAILFIGVLRDPVKNKWIVVWGIICCVLVIPLALIAGPIRGIPFFHQLIDCTFGVFGIIPLLIVRMKIGQLEKLITNK